MTVIHHPSTPNHEDGSLLDTLHEDAKANAIRAFRFLRNGEYYEAIAALEAATTVRHFEKGTS